MSARVVVVGGGITGLAAAWALSRPSAASVVDVTLVDASARLGGKILTEQVGPFLFEGGPDSFLTLKPAAVEFARELGLADRLIGTLEPGGAYVLYRGRLEPLPDGLAGLIPQRVGPFLRSGLFSPLEKARFACDLLVPASRNGADESLGAFVRRRLGSAAVDRLAAPLLAGIHAGDVDRLSLRATFPQFADAERRYGSLTAAILARRRTGRPREGAGLPMFMTLRGGLSEMVDAVIRALPEGSVRVGQVTRITTTRAGYALALHDGAELRADAVVLAVPASAAAPLLVGVGPDAAGVLRSIPYVSTAAVVFAFRRADVAHPLAGHGYVVARGERTVHTACTWVSSKWPYRAPEGYVVVRAYVGRDGDQAALAMDDGALSRAVLSELTPLLGLRAAPTLARVYRWPEAMPQYLVGHLERVAAARGHLRRTRGLVLAGSAYNGVGIPDCIRQGKEAAARVVEVLGGSRASLGGDSR
ncbi:MAG: protoporphyrinogen oxidase [bacterium]